MSADSEPAPTSATRQQARPISRRRLTHLPDLDNPEATQQREYMPTDSCRSDPLIERHMERLTISPNLQTAGSYVLGDVGRAMMSGHGRTRSIRD